MTTDAELLAAVGRLAARLLRSEGSEPVRAAWPATEVESALGLALPAQGRPAGEVLASVAALLEAAPAMAGPRFWNQLFGGRDLVATAADMLASVANHSLYTYRAAGPLVVVEQLVLARMAALAGFDAGEGTICPGGSVSNLCAVVIARGEAIAASREEGVDGRACRIYASAEAHYSVRKAAMIAGLGRNGCRDIPCDAQGRMDPTALDAALTEDRAAGLTPVLVAATAGTTVRGAFDPLPAIADVCARHGVWLHVDAAFGGAMLLSAQTRGLLAGVERADSLTWDAHKVMGVPLLCSALLMRRRGHLAAQLGETADYLFQCDDAELNPGTRALQCGRRDDALKLWALWQHQGDAGLAARVETLRAQALRLSDLASAHPRLQLAEAPPSLTVCLRTPGADAAAVCDLLAAERRQLVGHGLIGGERIVRVAIVDPSHDEAALHALINDIDDATQRLALGPPQTWARLAGHSGGLS